MGGVTDTGQGQVAELERRVRDTERELDTAQEELELAQTAHEEARAEAIALESGGWCDKLVRELSFRGLDLDPRTPPPPVLAAAVEIVRERRAGWWLWYVNRLLDSLSVPPGIREERKTVKR